ncbi:MAG: RNA methyltransferase [Deltaproteobacteria bacterium]|nr:RNA methyltransferase [Deltaproteobacteria bacterium]
MKSRTSHIAVVLCKPRVAGNVGAVARCGKNMGIDRLIVVGNQMLDRDEMYRLATHEASERIDEIVHTPSLETALADFQYVVGTTARLGNARGPVVSPREMAEQVGGVSQENRVALVFGPEDTGLTNEELRFCHLVVNIPTVEFRSLNLSHAVMILCYEILVWQSMSERPAIPKLATSYELEGMYGQIRDLLTKIGFLNPQNPEYWMMHLRRLFARTALLAKEVKIIRGICRQLEWFTANAGERDEKT